MVLLLRWSYYWGGPITEVVSSGILCVHNVAYVDEDTEIDWSVSP